MNRSTFIKSGVLGLLSAVVPIKLRTTKDIYVLAHIGRGEDMYTTEAYSPEEAAGKFIDQGFIYSRQEWSEYCEGIRRDPDPYMKIPTWEEYRSGSIQMMIEETNEIRFGKAS